MHYTYVLMSERDKRMARYASEQQVGTAQAAIAGVRTSHRKASKQRGSALLAAAFVLCSTALRNRAAGAEVAPGTVITSGTAAKAKGLLSPGVYWMVEHGMRIKVAPPSRLDWPPPYKEATEKYSGQVRLSDDRRSLRGYAAGSPFPALDANDPDFAVKLVWDSNFPPIYGDDFDTLLFDGQSQYVRPGKPQFLIEHFVEGHYAGYNEVGRTEVEPMPIDPDFLTSGRLWMTMSGPQIEPQSGRGNSIVRYRYADPGRGDDAWTWSAGSRRLRRLNEAMLNSATDANVSDADHGSGFNPKVEQYDYKFLAEKSILMPVNVADIPLPICPYDGGATFCPVNWELRHAYIVEARPRWGQAHGAPNTLESRNVLYFDSEMLYPFIIDSYNRAGELWRAIVNYGSWRDRSTPQARVAIYPFKRELIPGNVFMDILGGFSTAFAGPTRDAASSSRYDSWYINMGAVDKFFFTTESLARMAP